MAKRKKRLVLCVSNDGYPASLEVNKLYWMLPERGDDELAMIRVIDELGQDYLHPKDRFAVLPDDALEALGLSAKTRRRVLKALRPA